MIRAVVFDFDGVLANSEPLHLRAFQEVLAAEGLTLTRDAYYARYLGYDDIGAFRAIAADAHRPLDDRTVLEWVQRKASTLEALERDVSVLFPGARAAIERMACDRAVAIASGARGEEILRVLDRERLRSFFPVVVAAEDTPASKPDPAPYARAVELLQQHDRSLRPVECAAVEDSHWGLVSARAAGLRTIAITHSYPAQDLGEADLVIDHLDELTDGLLAGFRSPTS